MNIKEREAIAHIAAGSPPAIWLQDFPSSVPPIQPFRTDAVDFPPNTAAPGGKDAKSPGRSSTALSPWVRGGVGAWGVGVKWKLKVNKNIICVASCASLFWHLHVLH